MDGWKTFAFPIGEAYFSVAMLVSGSVNQEFTTQLNFQDVSHLETWDSCQERPCFPSMHVKSV